MTRQYRFMRRRKAWTEKLVIGRKDLNIFHVTMSPSLVIDRNKKLEAIQRWSAICRV